MDRYKWFVRLERDTPVFVQKDRPIFDAQFSDYCHDPKRFRDGGPLTRFNTACGDLFWIRFAWNGPFRYAVHKTESPRRLDDAWTAAKLEAAAFVHPNALPLTRKAGVVFSRWIRRLHSRHNAIWLVDLLACPACRSAVEAHGETSLVCSSCGKAYSVVRQIPMMIDRMLRRLVGRVLLVGLGLVLALVCGELALRATGLASRDVPRAEPHPLFGWRHIPSREWRIHGPDGAVLVRINSNGLRGPERPYEKPRDVFRILVLGDSMVEGSQVVDEATFPRRLERYLNDSGDGRRFEVLNSGTGGYGTDNELLFYQHEGAKYRPDLVLLAFCEANDVYDNSSRLLPPGTPGKPRKPYFELVETGLILRAFPCPCVHAEALGPFQGSKGFLRRHSAMYALTSRTIVQRLPGVAATLADAGLMGNLSRQASWADPQGVPLFLWGFSQEPTPEWQHGWRLTGRLVARLRELVAADGGRLVVVGIPTREQVHPDMWRKALEDFPRLQQTRWDLDQPEKMLQALATASGAPYVSVLDAFRQQGAAERLFYDRPDDAHLNGAGHALLARLVHAALIDEDPALLVGR